MISDYQINITDQFVLAKGVELIPVDDVRVSQKSKFKFEDTDYVVQRQGMRSGAKVVSYDTYVFLKFFKEPTRFVEVALKLMKFDSQEANKFLSENYQLLIKLISEGILVQEGSYEKDEIEPSVLDDEIIPGFSVSRSLSCLQDSEVFKLESESGIIRVLKIGRKPNDKSYLKNINNEVQILTHLAGDPSPLLIEEATHNGKPYICMEYIPGNAINLFSDQLKFELRGNDLFRQRLELCLQMLDKYTILHSKNVVHADVHPGNIIVDTNGNVRIIDFELSLVNGHAPMRRAAVPYYYDPNLARELLEGRSTSSANEYSDQYCVAAICFLILTGNSYLEYHIEQDELLRQIANERPRSFNSLGIFSWQRVEEVVNKALSKEASNRFQSLDNFSEALRDAFKLDDADIRANNTGIWVKRDKQDLVKGYVEQQIKYCAPTQDNKERISKTSPFCSIPYGATGIAYAFYRFAQIYDNSEYISYAQDWLHWTKMRETLDGAYFNAEKGVSIEIVGNSSLYHSVSGLNIVNAIVAHSLENVALTIESTHLFLEKAKENTENLDFSFGRPGLLLGISFLIDTLGEQYSELIVEILGFGEALAEKIEHTISLPRELIDSESADYLGISHGLAGALYSLLVWKLVTGKAPGNDIKQKLNEIAQYGNNMGQTMSWPIGFGKGQEEHIASWCNGTAGYTHLWLAAFRAYDNSDYLELAKRAGLHAYNFVDNVTDICCGLAGRAYSSLALYKTTGISDYLSNAEELALAAMSVDNGCSPSKAHGLYKGSLGVALLLSDLKHPNSGCLPLFELEGWKVG